MRTYKFGGIVMRRARKFIVVLLAMFMVVVVAAPMALAAGEEMVVAYVQVPEDWENPCLWAWDDEGNNAFDAWPGGEAEADPNNQGWYYCWLPSWVTKIIVNANAGDVQTGDFAVEGKDAWIIVTSPEEVEVVYESLTQGDAPAYVEKITVHAKVPDDWSEANLWAWLAPAGTNAFAAWPGKAMTLSDSGWYSAKVPIWINSVIVNAGEGNPQTEDLSVEPKEMWLVIADDGSAEINYSNPDQAVNDITVRVQAPASWADPCLWAWSHPDGTNAFISWPGEPLVAEGDWLTLKVPGWINRVIVNGNEGGIQTGDIEVEVGKDIWLLVTDAETYSATYEEPAAAEPPVAKNGIDTWIIVAIALAALVLVAVVVIVVRKKKKR